MNTLNDIELNAVSGGLNPLFWPAIIIAIPSLPMPEPSEEPVPAEDAE